MLSRRRFLSDNFSTVSSFAVASALTSLSGRLSHAEGPSSSQLRPVKDETTGLQLLRLPEGFRYQSFGWTGDAMQDGSPTPGAHDGMGVVQCDGDVLSIIRNHELSDDGGHMSITGSTPYDAQAHGGCTTLEFDGSKGQWLSSRPSCSGTVRNCAGGVTPWGTWLTCEETLLGPGDIDKYNNNRPRSYEQTHGWIFEVSPDGMKAPVPLTAMGRFVHEAVAIDRETGVVYETEDRDTAGFYRFIPNVRGSLAAGGTLQIAEVVGHSDLRGGVKDATECDVRWHTIPNPELAHTPGVSPKDNLGVFNQGKKLGGSAFSRLEGCWYGNGMIYLDATDGGAAEAGQIWQFDPKQQKLKLLVESPAKSVLNMPDNLCVSPRGGIVLCEDSDYGENQCSQRMLALSQDGRLQVIAENNVVLAKHNNAHGFDGDFRTKEWAGATFCPEGKWLFVNVQTPGITFAITGPWDGTIL